MKKEKSIKRFTEIIANMDGELKKLEAENKKLRGCITEILEAAPAMHKFTVVEFSMVLTARQCLKELEGGE